MENEKLINLHLLRPYVGDNALMQQQLLQAFEKELLAFHESMQDVTVNTNLEKVRAISHRISPSLTMLGLHSLMKLMEDYKQELASNEPNRIVLQTQQLMITATATQLLNELKMFFNE